MTHRFQLVVLFLYFQSLFFTQVFWRFGERYQQKVEINRQAVHQRHLLRFSSCEKHVTIYCSVYDHLMKTSETASCTSEGDTLFHR